MTCTGCRGGRDINKFERAIAIGEKVLGWYKSNVLDCISNLKKYAKQD